MHERERANGRRARPRQLTKKPNRTDSQGHPEAAQVQERQNTPRLLLTPLPIGQCPSGRTQQPPESNRARHSVLPQRQKLNLKHENRHAELPQPLASHTRREAVPPVLGRPRPTNHPLHPGQLLQDRLRRSPRQSAVG